jgi:hypothetical protein
VIDATLHDARAVTVAPGKCIARGLGRSYGDAALDFVWSVFNEPDLNRFWNQNPCPKQFLHLTASGPSRQTVSQFPPPGADRTQTRVCSVS